MATAAKPRPAQAPQRAQQAPSSALADPGPPPPTPAVPVGLGGPLTGSITDITRSVARRTMPVESAREALQGVVTVRQPPALATYKAEALEWLDRLEAYRAATR